MTQKNDRCRSRAAQNIPLDEPLNTREHGNLSFNTVVDESAKEVGRVHITEDGRKKLDEIVVEVKAVPDVLGSAVREQSEASKDVLGEKDDGKKKKKKKAPMVAVKPGQVGKKDTEKPSVEEVEKFVASEKETLTRLATVFGKGESEGKKEGMEIDRKVLEKFMSPEQVDGFLEWQKGQLAKQVANVAKEVVKKRSSKDPVVDGKEAREVMEINDEVEDESWEKYQRDRAEAEEEEKKKRLKGKELEQKLRKDIVDKPTMVG